MRNTQNLRQFRGEIKNLGSEIKAPLLRYFFYLVADNFCGRMKLKPLVGLRQAESIFGGRIRFPVI